MGFLRPGRAPAVVAAGLGKTYGGVQAVREATFEVARGEVFAVLGAGGAGKSTLLGMLCTSIPPTEGRATVAGFDVVARPRAVRRRIGVVTGAEVIPTSSAVLFLDQPASGLDSTRRVRLWHDLRRAQAEGVTVVYTTESVTDAEQADRIAVIDEGRIVALATPASLRAAVAPFGCAGHWFRPPGDELGAARRFMAAHLR